MIWISILFGIAAATLLVRSTHLLRIPQAPPGLRCFGWVTLIVTALAVLLHVLIAVGMLVISPEFGIAMVQGGTVARLGLDAALVAIGIVGGLGWHAARLRADRPDRRNQLVVAGLLIGVWAASQTQLVNPQDGVALQIHSNDVWRPPLQLWLAACLVATGLAESMLSRGLVRAFVITLALAALAMRARLQLDFADDQDAGYWSVIGSIAIPAAWAMAGWLTVPWPLKGQGLARTAVKAGVPFVGAVVGSVLWWWWWSSLATADARNDIWLALPGPQPFGGALESWLSATVRSTLLVAMVSALVLVWPLLLGVLRGPSFWRRRTRALKRVTAREWAILASNALIAASLAELFYVAGFSPGMALTAFLLGWIFFSELLYPGALAGVCVRAASGKLLDEGSPLRAASAGFPAAVAKGMQGLSALLAALFRAQSFPVALLKVVAAVLLLVALAEIPNAGKTIILAVQTPEGTAYKGIGQAVADQLASRLAVLNDELRPDLILLKALTKDGSKGMLATSHGSSTLDTALAKSSDVKWGEFSFPLATLVAPVQAPMRTLLGVRVISGSLHETHEAYTLLAESTAGENWTVTFARPKPPAAAGAPPTNGGHAPTQSIKSDDSKAGAAEPRPVAGSAFGPADAIPYLADELAFRIRRGDPRLSALGMTGSWDAFDSFRKGLHSWHHFEVAENYEELGDALDAFRKAVQLDPAFALAHYRLALALQRDGQPAQAVGELRESLRVSPDFLPAVAALAATLSDFDSFYYSSPAAYRRAEPDPVAQESRDAEARDLWQRLLQSPADAASLDLASANYGLCRGAFATLMKEESQTTYFETYFYCKRSDELYSRLPKGQQASTPVQFARAGVLYFLGSLLEQWQRTPVQKRGWHCRADDYDSEPDAEAVRRDDSISNAYFVGPFSAIAVVYYQRAAALLPQDRDVRCSLARMARATGEEGPIEKLRHNADARWALAEGFMERSQSDQRYLRLALDQYREALRLDPHHIESLNGFAYAAWRWILSQDKNGPDAKTLAEAERYARTAAALTAVRSNSNLSALTRSTLGEILLAQGRGAEALGELSGAHKLAEGAGVRHAFFNELRWDLAQAALCAAAAANRTGSGAKARKFREEATKMMRAVQDTEQLREIHQFGDNGLLPVLWIPC